LSEFLGYTIGFCGYNGQPAIAFFDAEEHHAIILTEAHIQQLKTLMEKLEL